MNRTSLLGTAMGMALLASPVLAQPMSPGAGMHQDQMGGPAASGPPRQDRDAQAADRLGGLQGPAGWLAQAENALRRGRTTEANELLERAETRALSRSTPAPMADQPMQGGLVEHTAAARAALSARDREGAMRQIQLALQAAQAGPGTLSGTDRSAVPMQGGNRFSPEGDRKSPPGGVSLRDSGPAGTSMGRAEHLTPPALPGRPLVQAQAGQPPANSMGESQRAIPGQPRPGVASPGVNTPRAQQQGTPTPGSGRNTPTPGVTSGGTSDTVRPPASGSSGPGGGSPGGGGGAGGSAD